MYIYIYIYIYMHMHMHMHIYAWVLTLKMCYYCGKCSYDCRMLCIGSCSSYVISNLNNLYYLIHLTQFLILIFYHYNLNTLVS